MKYIDAYLRKKKPETFMDYVPGEIPKKTGKNSVGAIQESPAKNNTITTVTPAKISNTYATSNRDLQNIHRNRNNSTSMSSRPERKRSGEISKRFLDYARNNRNGAQNDPHSTVNETYSANPYGSPVKIVGDNVTKKDYDDFWNAFHEESTGEKLNWAANQMQAKPQKQTPPQNRNSRNMMHWAMRERENLAPPQNTALTSELRDIEAAEKGDSNSEWFKRLESAWSSGDLDTYEAVEREMKAQKDRINYILKNRERTYDDNFFGQFGANYRAGRMSQDEALAWNEYYKSPTKENRAYAESISDTLAHFRENNAETLADDATLPWLSQSLAGNLPQMIDQTKAGIAGAAGMGLTAGFIATASGNPFVAGTAALKGAQAGYSIATAKQAYDVMRGTTFKKLLEHGMDEEVARAAANDEAVLSSLIEMTDSGMDVGTAVDILMNPGSAGVKGVLGILGKAGLNIAGEALEESLQEGISVANERRDGSGIFDLAKGAARTYGEALTEDGETRRRIVEAGKEGAKLATMTAAPAIIGGETYNVHSDLPDVQVEGDGTVEVGDRNSAKTVFEDAFFLLSKHINGKECFPENHNAFRQQGWQDVTDPRQVSAGNKAREYVKNGIRIIYEDGEMGARGFKGIDHYHIINPNATNNYDMYLDKYGNPTPKNSKQSHILKNKER